MQLIQAEKKESACQSNVGKYLLASGLNTAKLHDSLINQKQSNQLAGLVGLQPPPPPHPLFCFMPMSMGSGWCRWQLALAAEAVLGSDGGNSLAKPISS